MVQAIILGTDAESGRQVVLSEKARRLSTYVIGKIGMGKSTLLEQVALQDLSNGDGLALLDPHEDLAEDLLLRIPPQREKDVIWWDPLEIDRPFGLNPFFCADPTDPKSIDSKADNFIAALGSLEEFKEIFASAPLMKNILAHLVIAFIVNQGHTMAETPQFLKHRDYRQQFYPLLMAAGYPQVPRFWEDLDDRPERVQMEMVASSLNKLERFQLNTIMRDVFGQPKNAIDFRSVMDEGKIVIVKLSDRLGEGNASFIGSFVVWEILQAALSRSDTPERERRPFHLIADEFQRFMTTAFPRLQAEARKFGVDTVVAHQTRRDLDARSKGTTLIVGNLIAFRSAHPDAAELAGAFDTTPPPPAVVGQRATTTLSTDPWGELLKNGHRNPEVLSVLKRLRELVAYRDGTYDEPGKWGGRKTIRFGQKSSGISVEAVCEVDQKTVTPYDPSQAGSVREYSYTLLVLPSDNESSFPGRFMGLSELVLEDLGTWASPWLLACEQGHEEERLFKKLLDQFIPYREVASNLHRSFFVRRRESWEKAYPIAYTTRDLEARERYTRKHVGQMEVPVDGFEWNDFVFDRQELANRDIAWWVLDQAWQAFSQVLKRLGALLAQEPVLTESGQYEPIYDKPRAYSDVEAEIANKLTDLHQYTARCKLAQDDGQLKEYTLRTIPPPPIAPGAEERARRIKERSGYLYGRERHAVEEEIQKRLQRIPLIPQRRSSRMKKDETHTFATAESEPDDTFRDVKKS